MNCVETSRSGCWRRVRAARVAVAILLVASCKGNPGPAAAIGTPATTPSSASAGSAADARCATPCLFLDKIALADIGPAFENACGTPWPAASDADCDQLDYQRNCIYAANGYPFKDKHGSATFGKLAWYTPRAEFKESELTATASANIRELERRAAACRQTSQLAPTDVRLVQQWLARLAAGTPDVPALALDVSTNPPRTLSVADMRKRLIESKDQFKPGKAKLSRAEPSQATRAVLPGTQLHAITIDDGEVCADPDEECGGGVSWTLVFDPTGKLVALEEQMSACPIVYSMMARPVREGEILRNLDRPSLEQDQGLAIATPQCAGTARYRIAEEKDEVTHLDAIALVVDGVALSPDRCATTPASYCTNDGIALLLARGEHLDVSFTLPPGASCGSVELRANGHYVPTR